MATFQSWSHPIKYEVLFLWRRVTRKNIRMLSYLKWKKNAKIESLSTAPSLIASDTWLVEWIRHLLQITEMRYGNLARPICIVSHNYTVWSFCE